MKIRSKDFLLSGEVIPGPPYEQYKVELKHIPTGIYTFAISGVYDIAEGRAEVQMEILLHDAGYTGIVKITEVSHEN